MCMVSQSIFLSGKLVPQLMHEVGDKETFWLASELSSSNYSFISGYASTIGALTPVFPRPAPEEPFKPFRSPLLNPAPPPHSVYVSHDPNDLKPRLGTTGGVQHHRIPSSHPSHPEPMQICSAHALHLDHLGRPFWFNGSLRRDKAKKESVEMGLFTHVRLGSTNVTEGAWKVGIIPCLKKGETLVLEGNVKTTIDRILAEARRVDMEILGRDDLENEPED